LPYVHTWHNDGEQGVDISWKTCLKDKMRRFFKDPGFNSLIPRRRRRCKNAENKNLQSRA